MYLLTIAVNGEITRENVFANVIDAADDYAAVVALGVDMESGLTFIDNVAEAAIHSLVSGGIHSTNWNDNRADSVAVTGSADEYRISVSRIDASDDVPADMFIASRGIPVMFGPELENVTA